MWKIILTFGAIFRQLNVTVFLIQNNRIKAENCPLNQYQKDKAPLALFIEYEVYWREINFSATTMDFLAFLAKLGNTESTKTFYKIFPLFKTPGCWLSRLG